MGKASRRKRERRLGLIPPPSLSLEQRSETSPPPEPLPGSEKISGCLIEMIEPFLSGDTDIRECRAGIALAASAWNLALLPAPMRALEIGHLVLHLEAEAPGNPLPLEELLHLLVARKLQLYPDDPRRVVFWEVRRADRGLHVRASAILPAPEGNPGGFTAGSGGGIASRIRKLFSRR